MPLKPNESLAADQRYILGTDGPEYDPSKRTPELPGNDQPNPTSPDVGDPPGIPTPLKDPPPSTPEPKPAESPIINA